MSEHHAAKFFKSMKQDQALKARLQAVSDPKAFIQMAADRGYYFSEDALEAQLDRLPEDKLAALFNPGVGGRQRLVPR